MAAPGLSRRGNRKAGRDLEAGPARIRLRRRVAGGAGERVVTVWILGYVLLGAGFGLATYSRRHLFSEGPSRPAATAARNLLDGRLAWALICSALWPLMALTGLVSACTLARARARQRRAGRV